MSDALNDNNKDGSAIPVRFTRLYLTLLVILTALLTVGQGLTQWRMSAVQDELWIVRYTALQRNLSQQIVNQALRLTDGKEPANFPKNVAELREVFTKFEQYHVQSREGRVADYGVYIPNSDTIQRLYEGIRPEFDAYQRSVRRLLTLRSPNEVDRPDIQAAVNVLLANEKPFLQEIDTIVRGYTGELRARLNLLQTVELSLYIFTLTVLVGIGLLIFRPATRKLKQTIAQLVEAQSQTTAANRKLLNANKSLKETRQKLYEATKQQYQQQIHEQQIRTSALIAGQEEERKRLSRDLHDGLGQMLTAIKLQLEGLEAGLNRTPAAEQSVTPSYSRNLHTLKTLVTQTIQETRTISNNLMPTVLSDFGIVPALKMIAESDRTEAVDVTFSTNLTPDMPRLDRNTEIMLYRVTQEAVSNAIRHGAPSHVQIELNDRGGTLQLTVTDDGRGFRLPRRVNTAENTNGTTGDETPPDGTRPQAPSQGIHNMQQRAKLLNGKFKIYSALGKGTRVQVTIPYKTQPAHHDTY